MSRHTWTKEDIRSLFKTCQENVGKRDRLIKLQIDFPDCTQGSLKYAIDRYQKRNDNRLRWDPVNGIFEGYGSNGKLHDEVWNEKNWKS
jgi:hypothetical protein